MTTPFNTIVPARFGLALCNQFDQYVSGSLIRYGEFSQQEIDLLARYLYPGAVVLDVGANVGAITVPLAKLVGPSGRVIAFEPQRIPFQTLCANLALNSITNTEAWPYAVGHPRGATEARIPYLDPTKPNNFGGVELKGDFRFGESVPFKALDSLTLPIPTLVKIDVEGMEADVLRGANCYLSTHHPVLSLEADRPQHFAAIYAELVALGYDAWWHRPMLFSPTNWRGSTENAFPNIASHNWLALPKAGEWDAPVGLEPVRMAVSCDSPVAPAA